MHIAVYVAVVLLLSLTIVSASRKPFQFPSVWFHTLKNRQFDYVRPIYDFSGMLVQSGVFKSQTG